MITGTCPKIAFVGTHKDRRARMPTGEQRNVGEKDSKHNTSGNGG